MKRKEKSCMTCLWWGGEEADETAFCDEKEIDTCAGDHCPRWSKKPELSETMTEAQKQELWKLVEKGCTDSKVVDFCEENYVSKRTVFHQLAVWSAPEQCKGCEDVDMYPNMPPCTSCARSHTKDHYRPESPDTVDPLKAGKLEVIPVDWVREKITKHPGMESAMWSKLLRLWDAETKN